MVDVANDIKPGVITDKSGNTMDIIYVDGVPMMDFPEAMIRTSLKEHIKNIRSLRMRDEDIIICAYAKAGTHWLWEVLHMLRGKTTDYQKQVKEKQMLELSCTLDIDDQPSPRVLNTHLFPKHVPKEIFEKKTKIILMHRNPKDTLISLYFHYVGLDELSGFRGTKDDFIDMFLNRELLLGTWFQYQLEWEKFIESSEASGQPIYSLSFEDMIDNPKLKVQELAKFLEVDVTDEFINSVMDACSFQSLKKANDEYKDDIMKPFFKEGHSMYRKGKVGDWTNHLTVAQNEEFDRVMAVKMKGSRITFRYS